MDRCNNCRHIVIMIEYFAKQQMSPPSVNYIDKHFLSSNIEQLIITLLSKRIRKLEIQKCMLVNWIGFYKKKKINKKKSNYTWHYNQRHVEHSPILLYPN